MAKEGEVANQFAQSDCAATASMLQREGRWAESVESLTAAVVAAHKAARERESTGARGQGLVRGAEGVRQMVASWRARLRAGLRLVREDGAKALADKRQSIYHRGSGLEAVRRRFAAQGA